MVQLMMNRDYEAIGRFIYGAYRHGADREDVDNWMANDLGLARPVPDNDEARGELYTAFFAKYTDVNELQANYARFIASLHHRSV